MKLQILASIAFTLTTASFLACSSTLTAAPEAAEEGAIKAENQRWADAWNRNDMKAVVALYTEDARLLPDGQGPVAGHDAILQFLQKVRNEPGFSTISFSNFEFYGDGQSAAEYGEFEFRDKNGAVKATGKQMLIYVKVDGQWKLHRDIWTGTTPAKPAN